MYSEGWDWGRIVREYGRANPSKSSQLLRSLAATMMRFEDRVAIVAGGGAGVGLAAAARMGREGARIVLVEADRERGERAADLLDANGVDGRLLIGDPSTASAAKWAETTAWLVWGRLDIVVYAVQYPHIAGAAHTVDPSVLDAAYAVDVRGPLLYCKAAIPSMDARGYGRIVITASAHGEGGGVRVSTRAAMVGLAKAAAMSVVDTGIRVNAAIYSEPARHALDPPAPAKSDGRQAMTDGLAAAVCWLASSECSFTTGAVFEVGAESGERLRRHSA